MASLDALAPDQRAVLDLVLRRGRSYDDIAKLLGIDRAAVRARALAAFDSIGPETGISSESRALITDYLLGQLPGRVAEQTRDRLAESPYERAWARVVASELEPVAGQPLPEIPDGSRPRPAAAAAAAAAAAEHPPRDVAGPRRDAPAAGPQERAPRRVPRLSDRPSSRRGGAIMLGVGVLVVVAVVVILIATLGGGSGHKDSATVGSTPAGTSAAGGSGTTATGTTSTGTSTGATGTSTGTSTGNAQIIAQINLNPPSGSGSAKGVGLIVKDGSAYGIILEAQGVAPNSHNAYAAWLYNSPTDSVRLGFVNPAVGKTGKLEVGSALPANAGHYKELLLTLETQSAPKAPGTIVLQGALKGVPASG
jgi:hypothetical protein